jgi:hypothetical protein
MAKEKDWREERMSKIRKLIKTADPDVVEEQKYKIPSNPKGIPVWYHDGMICTGETYKNHLRLTFSKANEVKKYDSNGLFNRHSAIVIEEDDELDETAFKNIIKSAVKINEERKNK